MKKLLYRISYIFFPFWLALVMLLAFMTGISFDSKIPQIKPCHFESQFNVDKHLSGISQTQLIEQFNYTAYLDSANWCDINSVLKDIESINNFYNEDDSKGLQVIIKALTNRLESRFELRNTHYNPEGLIEILNWAMHFRQSSDDYTSSKLQRIINRFWFNNVSNKLSDFASHKPRLKYDFKFRYLVGICASNRYAPSIGNSKFEKVIIYFIDSKFCYMFNRFWHSTGMLFKLVVAFVILLHLYAYWCVAYLHFFKKNN